MSIALEKMVFYNSKKLKTFDIYFFAVNFKKIFKLIIFSYCKLTII